MKIADYLFIIFCVAIGIAIYIDSPAHQGKNKRIVYE
jgi:hypothetical protein